MLFSTIILFISLFIFVSDLTADKNTGLSRGTAFVKFEKADSATKALEYAQSNEIIVKNRACR